MKFIQRLKYYLIGFSLGLFFVFLLFKDRTWNWLPENRVLNFIAEHPILIDENIYLSLSDSINFSKTTFDVVLHGKVDFSNSNTTGKIKVYHLYNDNIQIEMALSFTDSISRITKFKDITLPYTKNLYEKTSPIYMDNENFINLLNDIKFTFSKIFNCQIQNWGFNSNIIKKNLFSIQVLWKESLPYNKPNPQFIAYITVNGTKYLIYFEKGDQRIRFKNIIKADQLIKEQPLLEQISNLAC